MSRYNSTAQESNLSKDKTTYIEDFGEQEALAGIQSRHVAIGEIVGLLLCFSDIALTAGLASEHHPHAAYNASVDGVELMEWSGPDDPQNPYAA